MDETAKQARPKSCEESIPLGAINQTKVVRFASLPSGEGLHDAGSDLDDSRLNKASEDDHKEQKHGEEGNIAGTSSNDKNPNLMQKPTYIENVPGGEENSEDQELLDDILQKITEQTSRPRENEISATPNAGDFNPYSISERHDIASPAAIGYTASPAPYSGPEAHITENSSSPPNAGDFDPYLESQRHDIASPSAIGYTASPASYLGSEAHITENSSSPPNAGGYDPYPVSQRQDVSSPAIVHEAPFASYSRSEAHITENSASSGEDYGNGGRQKMLTENAEEDLEELSEAMQDPIGGTTLPHRGSEVLELTNDDPFPAYSRSQTYDRRNNRSSSREEDRYSPYMMSQAHNIPQKRSGFPGLRKLVQWLPGQRKKPVKPRGSLHSISADGYTGEITAQREPAPKSREAMMHAVFIAIVKMNKLDVYEGENSKSGWCFRYNGTRVEILDLNCRDEDGRTALRIAINNRSKSTCELLLKMGIEIGNCLFHAIKQNFLDGVKVILECERKRRIHSGRLESSDYYFPGFTPMVLASYCNNYPIIKLLMEFGYVIEETITTDEVFWESANERQIMCKAKSSPAYITALAERRNEKDPFIYCMDLIEEIRDNAKMEPQHSEFYAELEENLENYMCSLLDEVRSSDGLLRLFHCETACDKLNTSNQISHLGRVVKTFRRTHVDGIEGQVHNENSSYSRPNQRFRLFDRSVDMRLLKFVTHSNSQQCIDYMNYKGAKFMHQGNMIKWILVHFFVGVLFPILSLFHLVSPNSRMGKIITKPAITFACHLMSDLSFVILVFISVVTKSVENDYLGSPPVPVDWLILFWVFGKWKQEVRELFFHGFKKYFSDWWNINDLVQLALLTTSIILRTVEYFQHANDLVKVPRYDWKPTELKLISDALLSWAYIFVCLRVLNLIRTIRWLGPLQLSLARMISNIIEFLFIFGLVVVAFALSLSELYWYYGTSAAKQMFCPSNNSTSGTQCASNVLFTSVRDSFGTLYWAIFGQFDLTGISLSGRHSVTEGVAWSLIALYHVVVILVMINMLIAMMSQSYDETSTNAEVEWKLHRAAVWLRFIRKENTLPPPMNIIPNIWKLIKKLRRSRRCYQPKGKYDLGTCNDEKLRKEAIGMLLERYKYNTHLTK